MFLRLYLDNGKDIQICESRKSIQERMNEEVLYPWYGRTNREMELEFDTDGNFQQIRYTNKIHSNGYSDHEGKIIDWKFEYGKEEDKDILCEFLSKKIPYNRRYNKYKKQLQEIKRKIYD